MFFFTLFKRRVPYTYSWRFLWPDYSPCSQLWITLPYGVRMNRQVVFFEKFKDFACFLHFINYTKFFSMNKLMSDDKLRKLKRKISDPHDHVTNKSTKSEESMIYFCDFVSTEWRIDGSNIIHPFLVVRSGFS